MRRATPAASTAAGALCPGTTAGQPAARAASSAFGDTRTASAPESRIAWPSCAGEKNSGRVTMVRPAHASARCQTMPWRSFGAIERHPLGQGEGPARRAAQGIEKLAVGDAAPGVADRHPMRCGCGVPGDRCDHLTHDGPPRHTGRPGAGPRRAWRRPRPSRADRSRRSSPRTAHPRSAPGSPPRAR